ncbi:MAG: DegV family protein [Eubacteriaceae bacterium]|jgi:DegV family protein with EDD domain|nr:DegV family protein [Eubacteriaceae bacterium]
MNKKIQIMTDSGSDLAADELGIRNINILKMPIVDEFGNECDVAGMGTGQFYQSIRNGAFYQTSQVPFSGYINAFRSAAQANIEVIYIGLSSGLSGTIGTAMLARQEVMEEFPLAKISVIDSLSATIGYGSAVLEASDMEQAGASTQEILECIGRRLSMTEHLFTVGDLSCLRRGGRLSRTAYALASTLNIKPVLDVDQSGRLAVIDKCRGTHKARQKVAETIRRKAGAGQNTLYCVHTDCEEGVHEVLELLHPHELFQNVKSACLGPVIGAHVGADMIGFVFQNPQKTAMAAVEIREYAAL